MKIWHNLRFLIIHFETLMYKSCILFSVLQLKTCPTLTCIWSAMLLEYAGKAPVIARDTPLWQIYCFQKLPPHVTGRQTLWILVCKAYSLFEIINHTLQFDICKRWCDGNWGGGGGKVSFSLSPPSLFLSFVMLHVYITTLRKPFQNPPFYIILWMNLDLLCWDFIQFLFTV